MEGRYKNYGYLKEGSCQEVKIVSKKYVQLDRWRDACYMLHTRAILLLLMLASDKPDSL